jgi:hypothetical protein
MDGEFFKNGQKSGSIARSAPHGGRLSEHRRRTMAAWERFVSGDDDVQGVSSSVLMSWYRCRDLYKVDPRLASAPRAAGRGRPELLYNSVFAQLGGIAAAIVERSGNCLTTVTDGDGRILASWGAGATMRKAGDSSLAPFLPGQNRLLALMAWVQPLGSVDRCRSGGQSTGAKLYTVGTVWGSRYMTQ